MGGDHDYTAASRRGLVWGTPKGHERRDLPIPRFLVDELAVQVAGRAAEGLVFPAVQGGTLRVRAFRRAAFDDAEAAAIGVPDMHPHEVRHTATSLAIASGAAVKVVQQTLGHKSATMTLALDAAARAAGVSPMRPGPTVIDPDAKRRTATAQ